MSVAGTEGVNDPVDDGVPFLVEMVAEHRLEFGTVQVEQSGQQTEDKHVLALVFGGTANRFDGQAGDRHTDGAMPRIGSVRLNLIQIVEEDAAFPESADVVVVRVLVKRNE